MEYSSIEAWPKESTKRSRFGQMGSSGSKRRNSCHKQYMTGAMPMGVPGWPEFACCTASMARVRIVLMHNWSVCLAGVVIGIGLATIDLLLRCVRQMFLA